MVILTEFKHRAQHEDGHREGVLGEMMPHELSSEWGGGVRYYKTREGHTCEDTKRNQVIFKEPHAKCFGDLLHMGVTCMPCATGDKLLQMFTLDEPLLPLC